VAARRRPAQESGGQGHRLILHPGAASANKPILHPSTSSRCSPRRAGQELPVLICSPRFRKPQRTSMGYWIFPRAWCPTRRRRSVAASRSMRAPGRRAQRPQTPGASGKAVDAYPAVAHLARPDPIFPRVLVAPPADRLRCEQRMPFRCPCKAPPRALHAPAATRLPGRIRAVAPIAPMGPPACGQYIQCRIRALRHGAEWEVLLGLYLE
jgi:hypothetical protein